MGDLLIIVGGLLFWLYERQKYMETHMAQGPIVKERSESLLTASKVSPYKSKLAVPDAKKTSAESVRKETETAAKGKTSKESLPAGGSAENAQKTKSAESMRKPGSSEVAAKDSRETKKNMSSVGIAPKQGSKEASFSKPLR
ncbi:unnamed protein product [Heligmosomoides polygyrus]|uniref:Membrane protein insertase YidC n=1 Tax=Heligmosomoides polygyrus TaxID=6339 RepID=A0A183G0G3_HELPZ|nr:unnamed protein product [Heligmosomoides polygyrus]